MVGLLDDHAAAAEKEGRAVLKTYAFWGHHPGIDPARSWVKQATACVAARSVAEVARLVSVGQDRQLRVFEVDGLSETANLSQMLVALGAPGIIFHARQFSHDYQPAGGSPLGLLPPDPETLIAEYERRYPKSRLVSEARAALPAIHAAWDAARERWPDATIAR